MSGHSKWATIKHKKGATDAKRAKVFAKLIRQVEVAARAGGSDLDANATLRTMYQKARDSSVPLDTIQRAIARGAGELDGVAYEEVTYEAYANDGVAMYIEALTDNRNRSNADVKSTITKNGGTMATPGSVSWQFDRTGMIIVPGSVGEDELMLVALDAGADDIQSDGDAWQLTCDPKELNGLRLALEEAGIAVSSTDLTMLPQSTIELGDEESAKKVLRMMDVLEDLDDVQNVYANFDIPDNIMDAVVA